MPLASKMVCSMAGRLASSLVPEVSSEICCLPKERLEGWTILWGRQRCTIRAVDFRVGI